MKNTIAKVIGGAMVATGTVAVGAIVWKKREREKTLEKERELLTVITEYLNHLESCVSQDELSVKELSSLSSQTSSIEERVNSIGLNVTMDLKKKEMVLSYRSFHRLSSDHDILCRVPASSPDPRTAAGHPGAERCGRPQSQG